MKLDEFNPEYMCVSTVDNGDFIKIDCKDIDSVEIISDCCEEYSYNENPIIKQRNMSMEINLTEMVDINLLNKLIKSNDDRYDIEFVQRIQKCKHKKKRINKKWLKKYGYINITAQAKGLFIKKACDGNIEFVK